MILAVAAAFCAGMFIQILPADAAQKECKKDEQSSCWIRVSQMFGVAIQKLQDSNKHFTGPFDDLGTLPQQNRDQIESQFEQIQAEIAELQMKETNWEFILERAG